jgi:indole-3-glycerol phosphate synthase
MSTMAMSATLEKIVADTRVLNERRKSLMSEASLRRLIECVDEPRPFAAALSRGERPTRVIAEVKRKSPSAGLIRPEYEGDSFEPEGIARAYEQAGAGAISCLTEPFHFGGDISYLSRVRRAVSLPVLRKDFLIDPWQVLESRAAGADAVLLIAECLEEDLLAEMAAGATDLGLDVLIEIHESRHLDRALAIVQRLNASRVRCLLGVNNRDLTTMRVDLAHTGDVAARLADRGADRSVLVSESGIRTPDDLRKLRDSGVHIVLVGESLMRQASPGEGLRQLLG